MGTLNDLIMHFLFNHAGMHGILLEIWQKKKQWLPMLMKWSWYVSSTLNTKQCHYVEILAIWSLAVYGFEPSITIVDMCCCIWCVDPWGHAHDWRGGGVLTRPRPVLRADWGEEKDLADIRPEHRWGFILFTSCNSSTVHSVCDVKNSMRSLTFFIICLLSNAQPVWQCLLGNWKASTLPCQYLISGGIV